ncbi:MAG: hypothetical protein ACYC5K_02450 [Saccharofermentanales bacterium]
MRLLDDCLPFANRHRGRHVTSGPHWSLIIRFVKLFDYACQMEAALNEIRAVARNKANPEADKAVIIGLVNDVLKDGKSSQDDTCPDCDGSGEVSGDYFADDGMTNCQRCGGTGVI